MALYLFDTGILLGFARGAPFAERVDAQHTPTTHPNTACVSVVSVGEIRCFPIRRKWGDEKRRKLEALLRQVPVVDINHRAILDRYAEISTYCEGLNPERPLPEGVTAHPMGDNDLWIAATASVIKATLITYLKSGLG